VGYCEVAAGLEFTVLLRNDGRVVACGRGVPPGLREPKPGVSYVASRGQQQQLLLQLLTEPGHVATCRNIATGEAVASWAIAEAALDELPMARVRAELWRPGWRVSVVLADGAPLGERSTWRDVFGE